MKIEIKSWISGSVLFSHEAEENSLRITLESAVTARANLAGAYLAGANLAGEVLTKAPISLINLYWSVLITGRYLRIGCQRHTHEEWVQFSDDQINQMDRGALKFWRKWKTALLALCDQYHEEPAKEEAQEQEQEAA